MIDDLVKLREALRDLPCTRCDMDLAGHPDPHSATCHVFIARAALAPGGGGAE